MVEVDDRDRCEFVNVSSGTGSLLIPVVCVYVCYFLIELV